MSGGVAVETLAGAQFKVGAMVGLKAKDVVEQKRLVKSLDAYGMVLLEHTTLAGEKVETKIKRGDLLNKWEVLPETTEEDHVTYVLRHVWVHFVW